jgi:acetyl esterase/lipase
MMTPFTRRDMLRAAATFGSLPLLAGCGSVAAFNAVIPADAPAGPVSTDIAYGPDPRQKLDIYAAGRSGRSPTAVFVYGGSWNNGDRQAYSFMGRALAANGITTVIPDYRLVPQVRYPEFIVDVASALRWAEENVGSYGGNPRHIVLVGHSAGAYNAVMVVLAPELRQAAGYRMRGLRGLVGLAGPYDFLPLDTRVTTAAFGQWPKLSETQPINRPVAGSPPMFLGTGDADTTVYPRNTTALAAHLRLAGRPVLERVYPGIGHAGILTSFAKPFRDRAPVLDDVVAFVKAPAVA